MSREYADPEIANLIAARVAPDEFFRRASAPLSADEARDLDELVSWFTRRYPTALQRLAYSRRKARQFMAPAREAAEGAGGGACYTDVARRIAAAHRRIDPRTEHIFLGSDPFEREVRLVEVTGSSPTTGHPFVVGFAARPDLGVPYCLALLLMSPGEWEAVVDGRLDLPEGWDRTSLQAL